MKIGTERGLGGGEKELKIQHLLQLLEQLREYFLQSLQVCLPQLAIYTLFTMLLHMTEFLIISRSQWYRRAWLTKISCH